MTAKVMAGWMILRLVHERRERNQSLPAVCGDYQSRGKGVSVLPGFAESVSAMVEVSFFLCRFSYNAAG